MFPVRPHALPAQARDGAGLSAALSKLIGLSRSRLLDTIATHPGLGVSELARRTDLSPANVSEHIVILRASDLVAVQRGSGLSGHHITELGGRLLQRQE